MKYIAYYGAFTTSILCLGILSTLIFVIIKSPIRDLTEVLSMLVAVPIVCFISVASAWIVCDMKKRMKDL